jgi:glycosyltransferase involved in cell wall biosynthesis
LYNLRNPIELNKNNPVNIQDNTEYLFIGRLSAEKGADFFCEAISDLGLRGIVIGDGHMLKELKDKYPDINFAGWKKTTEMSRYIRKSRALIFPSLWYEGSPLTIVEIKSHGIPCIVPDKCAACEEITDGETGYIFESGNLQSLKEAIMKIQQNDISVMSSNIINQFDYQIYTMDTHIKNLLDIYSDLL